MTVAPAHPPVHAYEGADPYELIPSKWGTLPRWHVNAQLTGEMRDYERVRNDAIEAEAKLADIEAREKAMLAEHLALQAERAAFDVEKRAFADQAAALAGRLSVEWGRIEKLRADHAEEPISTPPGDPSKLPEPRLSWKTSPDHLAINAGVHEDQTEFPDWIAGSAHSPSAHRRGGVLDMKRGVIMSTDQQHFDASRQFQAYYDGTLRKVGTHAPAPTRPIS